MAKISYASLDIKTVRPLVDQVAAERGDVLNLYRMLLHSAPITEGWLRLLTAIRKECELSDKDRELVIMRIAELNHAAYEAEQHRNLALESGLSHIQLEALKEVEPHSYFNTRENVVIALTDAMTKEIFVSDDLMGQVKKFFDAPSIIELVATIAAYNMVSRFLVALDIRGDDQVSDA